MMKTRLHGSVFIGLILLFGSASTFNQQDRYFEDLIDHLYDKYPDFISRLIRYNATRFGKEINLVGAKTFKADYVMELNYTDGYSVLVSNAFQHKMKNNYITSSKTAGNTMYKCETGKTVPKKGTGKYFGQKSPPHHFQIFFISFLF